MSASNEGRVPLAQALAALRDDLAAQPSPPAAVLAAARRAARQGARPDPGAAASASEWPGPGALRAFGDARRAGGWHRLRAWAAQRGGGAAGPREGWAAWAGAATLAGVLGVSVLLAVRPMPAGPEGRMEWTGAAGGTLAGSGQPTVGDEPDAPMHFVPLVSPERLLALAGEPGPLAGGGAATGKVETTAWVVTTELSQQRLAALGLPYDPGHAADRLRAELLVAASGEVLAVRLLR